MFGWNGSQPKASHMRRERELLTGKRDKRKERVGTGPRRVAWVGRPRGGDRGIW